MARQARLLAVILVLGLTVGFACGSAIGNADKTLSVALNATNAARDSFLAWDKEHQQQIVDHAESRIDAEAQLRVYRHERGDVLRAFTAAYTAIAAAATLIPLVERGDRTPTDLFLYVADAAKAAAEVKRATAAVRELSP